MPSGPKSLLPSVSEMQALPEEKLAIVVQFADAVNRRAFSYAMT